MSEQVTESTQSEVVAANEMMQRVNLRTPVKLWILVNCKFW